MERKNRENCMTVMERKTVLLSTHDIITIINPARIKWPELAAHTQEGTDEIRKLMRRYVVSQ
jgi:hypothetical protein